MDALGKKTHRMENETVRECPKKLKREFKLLKKEMRMLQLMAQLNSGHWLYISLSTVHNEYSDDSSSSNS